MNRLIEAVILRAARLCFAGTALDDALRFAKEADAHGYGRESRNTHDHYEISGTLCGHRAGFLG